ncbi:MAG TPA: ATP-binding protein [Longimicrobium sp.]|jgi:PAS domain S-box-containing protein
MSFDSVLHHQMHSAHDRIEALRARLVTSAGPGDVAQAALEELMTAMEELRVAEEELRQQNESLAAAQLLLEDENRRYVELFEYAPVPYVVTDEVGVIREANLAACELLGVNGRELRGKPLVLFIDREEVRDFRTRMSLAASMRARIDEWEVTLAPRGGEPIPAECSVQGVPARAGEPAGMRWMIRDISARRAEEARAALLGETERGRAFLEAVVRQMPEGVLIGEAPDGRIVLHNPEVERLFRHPILPEGGAGYVHPDGRPLAAGEYPLARVVRDGESIAGEELHYRRGDGTRAVMRVNGAPVADAEGKTVAGVVTFTDVTEERRRRQADRLLARTSELLASSLESAATLQRIADMVAGSLADYCIVHVEEGGELRAPGVAHADPRRREIVRGLLRRFPVDPAGEHPAVVCLRTGEARLIPAVDDGMVSAISSGPEHTEMLRDLGLASGMVVPMQARGRTLGAISFGRTANSPPYEEADLEVAQELARRAALAVDNARLYEEAQRASRAREEVLAVVSHDLRNPLNAIVLGTALLDDFSAGEAWSDRDRQQLRAIRNASQQMAGLIQDLVEVVALESGGAALCPASVTPADLVDGAVEMFREMAVQRGLTLGTSVVPGLPTLWADHSRVLRVLSNLLGNALKFTPAGGLITVAAAPAEGAVRFTVADTGTGIAPEHLPHLFDRYWQVRRGEKEGLGLGLAIAKGIVEAHGGRIWAESVPGEGATFHFTLPA